MLAKNRRRRRLATGFRGWRSWRSRSNCWPVALLAGRLLTPSYLRLELPWSSWALGLVILADWTVVTMLARRWRDGTIAGSVALCSAAAAVVILHAHSLRFTD